MLKLYLAYSWTSSPGRIAIAVAVTISFALLARALRGVTRSGMLAGGATCLLLLAGVGPVAFAALAALFLLTWVSTRFGYRRKEDIGVAERGDGRNARQVLANLAIPALASAAFAVTGTRAWIVAVIAALAEAATDTVASEIGQTSSPTAFLITTGRRVRAGTDGAITISGTLAGMIAGAVVTAVAAFGGLIPTSQLWIPCTAGLAGMLFDSLLGATLQRKGWMSNEAVNFFGTIAAAVLGLVLSR
ncbi:MAG: DUF92 domain-containing protein [Acidobacteria bacterium]|nr:DUF92 domain-containing protein [Acidobacteriota bacterium]